MTSRRVNASGCGVVVRCKVTLSRRALPPDWWFRLSHRAIHGGPHVARLSRDQKGGAEGVRVPSLRWLQRWRHRTEVARGTATWSFRGRCDRASLTVLPFSPYVRSQTGRSFLLPVGKHACPGARRSPRCCNPEFNSGWVERMAWPMQTWGGLARRPGGHGTWTNKRLRDRTRAEISSRTGQRLWGHH